MLTDLSDYNPNSIGNPNNNIFSLPFEEADAKLIIVPVPWEVTVSYGARTARVADHIFNASLQVDLWDDEFPDIWKHGFYMQPVDKKLLTKSDYLRKEAELYINYIAEGNDIQKNKFICKTLREINEGSDMLNQWVYDKTKVLLQQGKLVGLLGGDHSTPLGYIKAIAEQYPNFGILQIDAHCDLRNAYEGFKYSHASIMYNVLNETPEVKKLVQVGIRDYCNEEWNYIKESNYRVVSYFDKELKERAFEGHTWSSIADEIVNHLPENVFISFDIDGLDPKLCPHTGTPVMGGLETAQVFYIFSKILKSGRKIIGFDLNEVGISPDEWDENVGARVLYKLCNFLTASSLSKNQ